MGEIRTKGRAAFRDFATDGLPSSGEHEPIKEEVREFVDEVEDELNALSAAQLLGGVAYRNYTGAAPSLSADLAHPAGTPGFVWSQSGTHVDPASSATVTNKGRYEKRLGIGLGDWAWAGEDFDVDLDVRLTAAEADIGTAQTDIDGLQTDVLGLDVHTRTGKTTPVDADEIGIIDSAAANVLKKLTWANLKAGIWSALGALIAAGTTKATPVDADTLPLSDSAASGASKKLTWANLKTTLFASPTLTGVPLAPTASPGTDTTQLATTAFTQARVAVEEAERIAAVGAEQTARIADVDAEAAARTTGDDLLRRDVLWELNVTTGTNTAYLATSVGAPLTLVSRQKLSLTLHDSCGADPTLKIDDNAPYPLKAEVGGAIGAGGLLQSRRYFAEFTGATINITNRYPTPEQLAAEIADRAAADILLAPKISPVFTGTVNAGGATSVLLPIPADADDSTKATPTQWVRSLFALKVSPVFTGNPTAPTPSPGDNDTSIATTGFVKAAIDAILGGVSAALDTFAEVATALAAITTALGLKADKATTVSASGLATGGGDLSANRTVTVTAASDAEAITGTAVDKAVTPAADKAALDAFLARHGGARALGLISPTYRAAFTLGNQIVGGITHSGVGRFGAQPRVIWYLDTVTVPGQIIIRSPSFGGTAKRVTFDEDAAHFARLNGIELRIMNDAGAERVYLMNGKMDLLAGTAALAFVPGWGQSNRVGSGSQQALSTASPLGGRVRMFKVGAKALGSSHNQREKDWPVPVRFLNELVPAVERIYSAAPGVGVTGEGPDTQLGHELAKLLPANHSVAVANFAIGAVGYSDIKKGKAVYDNILEAVHRLHILCIQEGIPLYIPAIDADHGEAAAGAVEGDYLSSMQELQEDFETDIVKIIGPARVGRDSATGTGTGILPLMLGQINNVTVGATSSFVPQDQLQAMIGDEERFITFEKYHWNNVIDGVHLDAWGQAGQGAYRGRAIGNHHNDEYGGGMYVLTAPRTGATTFDLTFRRPFGGGDLEFTEEIVSDPGNKGVTWYQTGGTPRAIQSVVVTNPGAMKATVTLDGDPGSPSIMKFGIAWEGTMGEPGGPQTGVRSTLRSPAVAVSAFPLAEGSTIFSMDNYAMQQLINATP